MSQKSSVPQAVSFVSVLLKRDTRPGYYYGSVECRRSSRNPANTWRLPGTPCGEPRS